MIGKLKPLLVILLVLGFITGKSQCILLDNHPDLKSSVYCFIDSTGSLSLDQISNQRFQKYSEIKFSRFLLKAYRYHYWFKFCLENTQNTEKELLVSMGEVNVQDYFLAYSNGNKTHITVSQDKRFAANHYVGRRTEPIRVCHYALPIDAQPRLFAAPDWQDRLTLALVSEV